MGAKYINITENCLHAKLYKYMDARGQSTTKFYFIKNREKNLDFSKTFLYPKLFV